MELPEQPKPSFFSSVMSGIGGWFKGLIAGGIVGTLGGALIGAGIAAGIALLGPGLAVSGAAIGATALIGAEIGGMALSSIGAVAGAITGVIRSREAAQPSAGALVNALTMAHEHGQIVGQHQGAQHVMAAQQQQQAAKWGDRVRESAAAAVASATRMGQP